MNSSKSFIDKILSNSSEFILVAVGLILTVYGAVIINPMSAVTISMGFTITFSGITILSLVAIYYKLLNQ